MHSVILCVILPKVQLLTISPTNFFFSVLRYNWQPSVSLRCTWWFNTYCGMITMIINSTPPVLTLSSIRLLLSSRNTPQLCSQDSLNPLWPCCWPNHYTLSKFKQLTFIIKHINLNFLPHPFIIWPPSTWATCFLLILWVCQTPHLHLYQTSFVPEQSSCSGFLQASVEVKWPSCFL